jgi:hypothetical protein
MYKGSKFSQGLKLRFYRFHHLGKEKIDDDLHLSPDDEPHLNNQTGINSFMGASPNLFYTLKHSTPTEL